MEFTKQHDSYPDLGEEAEIHEKQEYENFVSTINYERLRMQLLPFPWLKNHLPEYNQGIANVSYVPGLGIRVANVF